MNFVSEFLSFMAWLMARPRRSLEVLGLWVYLFIKNNAAAVQDEDGSWAAAGSTEFRSPFRQWFLLEVRRGMQWKPGGIPPGTPSGTKPVFF